MLFAKLFLAEGSFIGGAGLFTPGLGRGGGRSRATLHPMESHWYLESVTLAHGINGTTCHGKTLHAKAGILHGRKS